MGLLDDLKKLTKPYDDEDYLEEDLAEPVRVQPQQAPQQDPQQGYAAYAQPPQPQAQPQQGGRRPYVFSGQAARQQPQYAPQGQYAQGQQAPNAYAQPNPYAQQPQQAAYAQAPQANPYAQQPQYAPQQQAYAPRGGFAPAQPRLLLVKPDRFDMAADIADRIAEKNAVVLNLEETERDTARRLLDFLSGVTYAVSGNIKKVSGCTYIITPAGMEFMADAVAGSAGETKENYF